MSPAWHQGPGAAWAHLKSSGEMVSCTRGLLGGGGAGGGGDLLGGSGETLAGGGGWGGGGGRILSRAETLKPGVIS